VPHSKLKHELINVLVSEGYIKGVEKVEEDGKPALKVDLK
jgi:small subunit ribosomal protein S8